MVTSNPLHPTLNAWKVSKSWRRQSHEALAEGTLNTRAYCDACRYARRTDQENWAQLRRVPQLLSVYFKETQAAEVEAASGTRMKS